MARIEVSLRSRGGAPLIAAAGLTMAVLAVAAVAAQNDRDRSAAPRAVAGITADAAAESHRQMLQALRDIAVRTDAENPWLGEGRRDAARARLEAAERGADEVAPGRDEVARFRALLDLAEQDLRLADERAAIDHFTAAYAMLPRLAPATMSAAPSAGPGAGAADRAAPPPAGRIDPREAARAVFRLGVAHLRYGESQNCAARHSAQSCILPIRGAGVHADPEGSRQAIRYFEEVMARVPQSSPLFLKAVWLANLAHMTLGGYPDAVPERYRVPPSVFASEQAFPTLPNVAPELGVATWSLSGGVVIDDFDGDGDFDLLTTTFDTRGEPRYFRNDGGAFVDRTAQSGLSGLYGGLNLVQSDYDNDGDLDAFVLRGAWLYAGGRHPGSLLRNDGAGRFSDVTFASGLGAHRGPTQTGAWGDVDGDGDVDLFIGNEHGPNPDYASDPGAQFDAPSELWRNDGDGTFTEVAAAAGIELREYVKGVVFGDYDNDGDPDLYASVLGGQNHLYRNDGRGAGASSMRFTDVTATAGVGSPVSSFPVWFWDYDNDGNLDLYVSTYAGAEDTVALVAASYFGLKVPYELPRLYHGDGAGQFEDRAEAMGLRRFHAAMGSNFGDLDSDGWLDFYLGTGYPNYEGLMPNVLYRGVEGRRFADVTLAAGVGHLQKGHAVAIGDYDADGDQDLFVQMGGAYPGDRFADALFQNPGSGNHWLGVELVGTRSNRAGIGARIRADVMENGTLRSIHREVSSGGSFGCNPLRQTLGLGRAERVERLEVWWPASGVRQAWRGVRADTVLRIVEPR
jgi:ASPIC and UnbV/FG-GAP-like repeat